MELENLSTDQLLQMYANAKQTAFCCHGHFKTRKNEELIQSYSLVLKARNIIVASSIYELLDENFKSNIVLPSGIYNGHGSY